MSDPMHAARRTVLAAGASVLAGGVLTACGGTEEKPKAEGGSAPTEQAPKSPEASVSPTGQAKAMLKSSQVEVGGGKILKEEKLVITQPTAGSFRCFTAVCTHQGCLVDKVADGSIDCPCHGSKFSATDGSVTHGPATLPLAEKEIVVSPAGEISLA